MEEKKLQEFLKLKRRIEAMGFAMHELSNDEIVAFRNFDKFPFGVPIISRVFTFLAILFGVTSIYMLLVENYKFAAIVFIGAVILMFIGFFAYGIFFKNKISELIALRIFKD